MADNFDLNNIGQINGLSEKEAAQRLAEEGYNEIPSAQKSSLFKIALNILREPMLLLLIASGTVYIFIGDIQEALMLLGFVFVIIGITLYQERKTERTLEALRDLSSPRAMVIRDGESKRIAGREVARGDLIVLKEGDRVPADGAVLSCNSLTIDESLLTGESIAVCKNETTDNEIKMERPCGDNSPFVYSGSLVVSGLGIARVVSTGINTEFGRIGKSLRVIEPEETLLQKDTRYIVRNVALAGLFLCCIMLVVYGLTIGDWLDGLLASITLAMAILPEEFPVVLTVFLALGAWRISKNQVLTRRMPAIETLGSATVLCVDKTGTLTHNRMSVKQVYADGDIFDIDDGKFKAPPEKFHQVIEFGILASQIDPFDPMEKALKEMGENYHNLVEHLHRDWKLQREYSLSKKLLALSRVWQSPGGDEYIVAAKGAPEAVCSLCHMDNTGMENLSKQIEVMAARGLRILGVCQARFKKPSLPDDQHDFIFEFVGLIGFADPVRPAVPDAIKECYQAGIKVVMITGDYPVTAQNIARQIGLRNSEAVITGAEMEDMNNDELGKQIRDVNIFARVTPEQKLYLVEAFKKNGETVSMTGDGVNDAPALKSAHIGIAMGGRGTDVAREAGALVLLDDDFSSIVKAVRLGRRIFDNLRKAMSYILAVHVPIAGLSLIPVFFKWPLALLPVHVVFLELIIDPACSVAFEAERPEPDIMQRPPRDQKEPLLSRRTLVISLIQGLAVLIVTVVIYGFVTVRGRDELEARALTFTTLVIANLSLILVNRYWSSTVLSSLRYRNTALYIIITITFIFLGLVLYVPPLRDLFGFGVLHATDLLICLAAALISISWFEVVKLLARKRGSS